MTIQKTFFNWATSGLNNNAAPYEQCSPNLERLLAYLLTTWGGYSLGCHQDRDIREGSGISSHAYGAAFDWRYTPVPTGRRVVSRATAATVILPWIINRSAELHIDAIHDYFGDRIWRAGRTSNVNDAHGGWWKKQYGAGSGMGEKWATYFHFETHKTGWTDAKPIADRLNGLPALISKAPPPTLKMGVVNKTNVRWLQTILHQRFGTFPPVDGIFGRATHDGVIHMQKILRVGADGVYGPQTATALANWLARH